MLREADFERFGTLKMETLKNMQLQKEEQNLQKLPSTSSQEIHNTDLSQHNA